MSQGVFISDTHSPIAVGNILLHPGASFSAGVGSFRTITGPFQGSMFDPITPDDPRWVWTWSDMWAAASFYQTGAEPDGLWMW